MDKQLKEEIYKMSATKEIADRMIANIEHNRATKTLCSYPWSEFYLYMEDIPDGTRLSTIKDCETCEDKDCDCKYCLIEDPEDG